MVIFCLQDSPLPAHPLKAVPIAVADEGESESEDDDLKPRGNCIQLMKEL